MKAWTSIIAIMVIGALEVYALSQGINGLAMSLSVGLIAGLGGFSAKSIKDKIQHKNGG